MSLSKLSFTRRKLHHVVCRLFHAGSWQGGYPDVKSSYDIRAEESVQEGAMLGVGVPSLEIQAAASKQFLNKYGLRWGTTTMADHINYTLINDLMDPTMNATYTLGGSIHKILKIAQWSLHKDNATTLFGNIGRDRSAAVLNNLVKNTGIRAAYQNDYNTQTNVCVKIRTSNTDTIVHYPGAACKFSHISLAKQWELVEAAKVLYVCGHMFNICTNTIVALAAHAASSDDKQLVMKLTSHNLAYRFADKKINVMPYIDVLFCNISQLMHFAYALGLPITNTKDIARMVTLLPKENKSRPRTVVITGAKEHVLVAHSGHVETFPMEDIPVEDVVTRRGCTEAFIGGYIAKLAEGCPIYDCVHWGEYCAQLIAMGREHDMPTRYNVLYEDM